MKQTPPHIEDVAETLVANGAVYVAATEQSLAEDSAQLYYHTPAGTSDERREAISTYLNEEVGHLPYERQIGAMELAGEPIPTCVDHLLHSDLHLYRRVPIYVDETVPGLDEVSITEGIERAEKMARGETDPAPHRAETVSLEHLLEELAGAGAASVELAREFLVIGDDPEVRLRIPTVPAEAKPIVAPVEFVTVNGDSYPLRTVLTLDGPYGDGAGWSALYIGEDVRGLLPRPVEEGVGVAEDLLGAAEEAESLQELERMTDTRSRG